MNAKLEATEHQVTLTKTVTYTVVVNTNAVNADEAIDSIDLSGTYDWVERSENVEITAVSPDDWEDED